MDGTDSSIEDTNILVMYHRFNCILYLVTQYFSRNVSSISLNIPILLGFEQNEDYIGFFFFNFSFLS